MTRKAEPDTDPTIESRRRVHALGFAGLVLSGVTLCLVLAFPLFAPIVWAAVLAVVAAALQARLERRTGRPAVASALVTTIAAALVGLPFALVAVQVVLEASDVLTRLQGGEAERLWQQALERFPRLARFADSAADSVDVKALAGEWAGGAARVLRGLLTGSIAAVTGWLVMVFILFHFLRDRARVLGWLERVLPLTRREARELFRVAGDTIHATVYGTLGVAAAQGLLGGLLFWALGLPAPVLWGTVMGVLSVLPVLGAAIVWMPVAAFFALRGEWAQAAILAGFGAVVIGLVDNLIYPLIVKGRIRLHAVPVFVSILGGLVVFGASGVILGPLVLALADALLKQWKRHLDRGQSADVA